jgi:plastocyanin
MKFLILGLGAVLLSCAGMRSEAADTTVEIKTFAFAPQELTVIPGTTVTWINHDQTVHNVVSPDGKFASPGMDTDDRYTFKFEKEGDFAYLCALHPHMVGTVHVHSH